MSKAHFSRLRAIHCIESGMIGVVVEVQTQIASSSGHIVPDVLHGWKVLSA